MITILLKTKFEKKTDIFLCVHKVKLKAWNNGIFCLQQASYYNSNICTVRPRSLVQFSSKIHWMKIDKSSWAYGILEGLVKQRWVCLCHGYMFKEIKTKRFQISARKKNYVGHTYYLKLRVGHYIVSNFHTKQKLYKLVTIILQNNDCNKNRHWISR